MKKRILSMVLIALTLCTAACKNAKPDGKKQVDSTEIAVQTVKKEEITVPDTEDDKQAPQKKEEVPAQPDAVADTPAPEAPATTQPAVTQPAVQKPAATQPATEQKAEAPVATAPEVQQEQTEQKAKPYLVSIDIIEVERVNKTMLDGQPLLDRLFGKNKRFHFGDKITFKINMSDGGTDGFKLETWYTSFDVKVVQNGNIITLSPDGMCGKAGNRGFVISAPDAEGNVKTTDVRPYFQPDFILTDLRDYAESFGIKSVSPIADEDGKRLRNDYLKLTEMTGDWLPDVVAQIEHVATTYKYYFATISCGFFDLMAGNEFWYGG